MKLDSQRSKLEGWSIWSERARQLVSKALEVIATGEVYHEPPMDATNERQPMGSTKKDWYFLGIFSR